MASETTKASNARYECWPGGNVSGDSSVKCPPNTRPGLRSLIVERFPSICCLAVGHWVVKWVCLCLDDEGLLD